MLRCVGMFLSMYSMSRWIRTSPRNRVWWHYWDTRLHFLKFCFSQLSFEGFFVWMWWPLLWGKQQNERPLTYSIATSLFSESRNVWLSLTIFVRNTYSQTCRWWNWRSFIQVEQFKAVMPSNGVLKTPPLLFSEQEMNHPDVISRDTHC